MIDIENSFGYLIKKGIKRMSLKCMINKWLYKGQISQEEYDAFIKKLEGHDKQVREDAYKQGKTSGIDELSYLIDRLLWNYDQDTYKDLSGKFKESAILLRRND